jgi:Beta protein
LLIERINELPRVYEWSQLVFASTSLPHSDKMRAGEQKVVRRSEWHIRRLLQQHADELYRVPIFSDYGVSYARDLTPRRVRPTARINYSRADDFFCAKGQNVKIAGYEAIFPVADAVVGCEDFKGAGFSLGDDRMIAWHRRTASTGNAPTWRWSALDHHLAMIVPELAAERGMMLPEPKSELEPVQGVLFPAE